MANTYTLISSNVLSSSAASVTFSAIPSTYTDLVIRGSSRIDGASTASNLGFYLNSTQGTSYSFILLRGNGATASSSISSGVGYMRTTTSPGTAATTNTFSNFEIYIPNYAGSTNKPVSGFGVGENNATTAYIDVFANLGSVTSAITSITLYDLNSYNLVSGSSFYLYGIKNS